MAYVRRLAQSVFLPTSFFRFTISMKVLQFDTTQYVRVVAYPSYSDLLETWLEMGSNRRRRRFQNHSVIHLHTTVFDQPQRSPRRTDFEVEIIREGGTTDT